MEASVGGRFASLPGSDFDLSFEDCQSLLNEHPELQARDNTDSPTAKAIVVPSQDRHDSTDSAMQHDPGIIKSRTRKPRSQEQARHAQKLFRLRQKVACWCYESQIVFIQCQGASSTWRAQARSENLHSQLNDTQVELNKMKARQQQLEMRNTLLEKVAQINEVQKSVECLMWEVRVRLLAKPACMPHTLCTLCSVTACLIAVTCC